MNRAREGFWAHTLSSGQTVRGLLFVNNFVGTSDSKESLVLKVSEPKVHLSVDIFWAQMRFAFLIKFARRHTNARIRM